MKINSKVSYDNPDYFSYDEDYDGDWHDYFMCPNCKSNFKITIEDIKCFECGVKLEWY